MSDTFTPAAAGFFGSLKRAYRCTADGWGTRAARREYWLAALGLWLINILLYLLLDSLPDIIPADADADTRENVLIIGAFLWLFLGALPLFCLFIRRLHDCGSGGLLFGLLFVLLSVGTGGLLLLALAVLSTLLLGIPASRRAAEPRRDSDS